MELEELDEDELEELDEVELEELVVDEEYEELGEDDELEELDKDVELGEIVELSEGSLSEKVLSGGEDMEVKLVGGGWDVGLRMLVVDGGP